MMVEADVPNADGSLVPGAYATVMLSGLERTNALYVPIDAIQRSAGGASVLRVDSAGQVTTRSIRIGIETPARIEVLEGLDEGDVVVTGGAGRIRAGQPVEPQFAAAVKAP
jgi:membrane fusion protein (multidrug efflux system)